MACEYGHRNNKLFPMECKGFQKLPLVVSSKPFYIQRNFRVPPSACCPSCNFKAANTQDSCHKHSHERNLVRLNEMRWYIQHSVDKDKYLRADRLKRKKEADDLELQRRRQWVLAHKLRHQEIIEQMKLYLQWCRRVYFVTNPCDCGCEEGVNDQKTKYNDVNTISSNTPKPDINKTTQGGLSINTVMGRRIYNKGFQYLQSRLQDGLDNSYYPQQHGRPRLDHLAHQDINKVSLVHGSIQSKDPKSRLRFNRELLSTQKRTGVNSFTFNKSSKLSLPKLKSLDTSMVSKPVPLIDELSAEYFQRLACLEKDVKIHLTSNQTVQSMLKQIATQNMTSGEASLDIVSLTKKSWEMMFKSIVTLKKLEDNLIKVSLADNITICYDEESELCKQLLDDLYSQLTKNPQYLKHIEIQIQQEKQEQEHRRMQHQDQQQFQKWEASDCMDNSYPVLRLQSQNIPREQDSVQQETGKDSLNSPQPKYQMLIVPPYKEFTQLLTGYRKSGAQQRLESVINQRVKKQLGADPSKLINRQSAMSSNKRSKNSSVLADFNVEQLIKTKSGQNSFSVVLPLKQKSKRVTLKQSLLFKSPPSSLISKKSLVKAPKKPLKSKKKVPLVIKQIPAQLPSPEPQDQNEPAVVEQVIMKGVHSRFDNSNFINRMFQDSFKWPQQESTLKNYQHQSIFSDKDLAQYETLKVLKTKKKVNTRSQSQDFQLKRINKDMDKFALGRKLHQLFTMDYYMLFVSEAQQYRMATQKAEHNQDLITKIDRGNLCQDNFGWANLLNFQPVVYDVDLVDLLVSQKIKQSVWKKKTPCLDDQVEFTKELVVSPFQKQTHHSRVRAFRIQSNFMTHKKVNNGERVFLQQTI